MMVDADVHFHVIPRYERARYFDEFEFIDFGWRVPPDLSRHYEIKAATNPRIIDYIGPIGSKRQVRKVKTGRKILTLRPAGAFFVQEHLYVLSTNLRPTLRQKNIHSFPSFLTTWSATLIYDFCACFRKDGYPAE